MTLTIAEIKPLSDRILDNLEKVIVGKRPVLELTLACLLARGHLLIEDVPGVGKTMLARSLAQSLGCGFNRIQFTPDLLPGDLTGTSIFNQATRSFEFIPGPLISQVVLADEVNRATPKTQSALLEAMEEHQVTVDGAAHILPEPFMVIGTQNPIEYEGTFPLPEAQLDRFLLRLSLGYPGRQDEIAIMDRQQFRHPIETLEQAVSQAELLAMQETARSVFVSPAVKEYIVDIIGATRKNENIDLGASPRGSLGLYHAGQALAAVRGREFVLPDDIKALAEPVLAHRLVVNPAARLNNLTAAHLVRILLQTVPLPDYGLVHP
ncbi:MAG TPA: MoxR family ATPase [Anaerolineaceae bacterium]|nr:MoxR family ATPase [Anaerolineaceae bacterium]HPN51862.1 MoxR family ATPase [Anaerolineaceae bacterium]